MAKIGDVVVGLRANTTQFTAGMGRARKTIGLLNSSMMKMSAVFLGATGIVALFRSAANASRDFEYEMVKIITLVGVAEKQVNAWSKEIRQIGLQVGKGPTELARALFAVTSAGIRTGDALKIVTMAAKASAVGLGDTATIARTVTAAMQSYSKAGLSAARATDILVATVREGNLEAESLAGSLGRVMGIASQVGISFADMNAFIATFTRLGVSAEEAVTSLRTIIISFLKPQAAAKKQLEEMGISVDALRKKIQTDGLAPALVDLAKALDGNQDAIAAVIPEARALSGFLGVAAAQSETFLEVTENINNAMGINEKAFQRTRETGKQSGAEIKAVWSDLMIFLGGPVLTGILAIGDAFGHVIDAIAGRDRRSDIEKVNDQIKTTMDLMYFMIGTGNDQTTTFKQLAIQLVLLREEYRKLGGVVGDVMGTMGGEPTPRERLKPEFGPIEPSVDLGSISYQKYLFDKWIASMKEGADALTDFNINMDLTVDTTDKVIDNIERLTMALANLARGLRFNFLGGIMGGIFGFLRGGPLGAGIGAAGGLLNVPGLRAEDFQSIQTQSASSQVQIVMQPATNSLAQARDADWLGLIAETNRALGMNGYRFGVVG